MPHSALETRPFTVTRVDSLEAFDSFAHEWDDLLRSSEVNGFFLSRAWVRAWYVACAEEFEMFVLAVRDGAQRLVGIAPLARSRRGRKRLGRRHGGPGLWPRRVLTVAFDVS